MPISHDQEKMWFEFSLIPGTKFKLNDSIIVGKGQFVNLKGSVISLEEINDDPLYCVELKNGETIEIQESYMNLIE